jgi:hypothetical protein
VHAWFARRTSRQVGQVPTLRELRPSESAPSVIPTLDPTRRTAPAAIPQPGRFSTLFAMMLRWISLAPP